MALNKDQILHADDLPRREVQTPEWGGSVFVRALTGDERDSYEGEMLGSDGTRKTDVTGVRARLAVRTIVDEGGRRIFDDQDAFELGAKSAAVLQRIFESVLELSGMTEAAAEDAVKNSDDGPSEGSTSTSP